MFQVLRILVLELSQIRGTLGKKVFEFCHFPKSSVADIEREKGFLPFSPCWSQCQILAGIIYVAVICLPWRELINRQHLVLATRWSVEGFAQLLGCLPGDWGWFGCACIVYAYVWVLVHVTLLFFYSEQELSIHGDMWSWLFFFKPCFGPCLTSFSLILYGNV